MYKSLPPRGTEDLQFPEPFLTLMYGLNMEGLCMPYIKLSLLL